MPIPQFIAGLSLAGKLVVGASAVALAATGAAATGSLPAPVQHAVASAVDAVTPFQIPDPHDGSTTSVQTSPTATVVVTTAGPDASSPTPSSADLTTSTTTSQARCDGTGSQLGALGGGSCTPTTTSPPDTHVTAPGAATSSPQTTSPPTTLIAAGDQTKPTTAPTSPAPTTSPSTTPATTATTQPPAVTPTALTLSCTPSTATPGSVSCTWSGGPGPQFAAYHLMRSQGSGFQTIYTTGEPTASHFVDTALAAGSYSYVVTETDSNDAIIAYSHHTAVTID